MAVDYLGLVILLIGIALMVAELANPGYFIGVAGTTGIVVGLIQMAWPDFFKSAYSPFVAVGVAVLATWGSIEFYRRFAPATKVPETLSSDALIGRTGRVVTTVRPNELKGKVKIGGIEWSATSTETIPEGADVVVRKVEGVHLEVEPAPKEPPPPTPTEGEAHGS